MAIIQEGQRGQQQPDNALGKLWNKKVTRRGALALGATGAAAGAGYLVFGRGSQDASSISAPNPEVPLSFEPKFVIDTLPNNGEEVVINSASPRNLTIRKGSEAKILGRFKDEAGVEQFAFSFSDPQRKTPEGATKVFTGIAPISSEGQGVSLKQVITSNGVVYDSDQSMFQGRDGAKSKVQDLTSDSVDSFKHQAGAIFVDRNPITKTINDNPVVPYPPGYREQGLVIDQLTNSVIAAKDAEGKVKNVAIPPTDVTPEWSWQEVNLKNALNIHGIAHSISPEFSDDTAKPGWEKMVKSADVIVPRGASMQLTMDQYGTRLLERWMEKAKANGQKVRFNSSFGSGQSTGEKDVSKVIAGEKDPVRVEAFMRDRLKTLLTLRPDQLNPVLEPFTVLNGRIYWRPGTPWYDAYGTDWPRKAFQFANEEAAKLGLVPGKDVKLYWNDYELSAPGMKLDATVDYISQMKKDGIHVDGVGLQIYPDDPTSPAQLKEVFNKVGELGETYIEYETWQVWQRKNQNVLSFAKDLYNTALQVNKESGRPIITGIGQWDNLGHPSNTGGAWRGVFHSSDYEPTDIQTQLSSFLVSA